MILLAVWYVAFGTFTWLYPYCHAGHEPHTGVCYLGGANYGDVYQQLAWLSFFWAVPAVVAVVGAFFYLRSRRQNGQQPNNALERS